MPHGTHSQLARLRIDDVLRDAAEHRLVPRRPPRRPRRFRRLPVRCRPPGNGEPATVLIGGVAGIGKTRLVEEFCRSRDARVLLGQCLELGEEGLPVAAALRELCRRERLPRHLTAFPAVPSSGGGGAGPVCGCPVTITMGRPGPGGAKG